MIHHRQTTVLERSAFTREHRGCEVLSNLLQVYREQSVLRIEREHAVIAGILKPAIRALEAPQSGPPQRAQAAVMPAMAAVALTRVERIESVLIETSRRQFVTRPAPPAAGLTAAEQAPPAASRFARAVPETRPAASPAMTPVDLERLTDRLMRNIDRRLVASRERNGRT
jgi:hypothetical protein